MNKKILIVRGNEERAKALSFLLAGSGYRISSHTTGGQAVEAARRERFDLAITDREIPENATNLDLIASLKESQPNLPIVLLSKENDLESIIRCIRAGVTDVIEKPNDLKEVFEYTTRFLNKDSASGEAEVTWDDMIQVEQALATMFRDPGDAQGDVLADEIDTLKSELEAAQASLKNLASEKNDLGAQLARSQKLIEEFKRRGEEDTGISANSVERMADLEARERELEEQSSRLSKQKAETEILLCELEAQRIELEEARAAAPAGTGASSEEIEAASSEANHLRLEQAARIQDLERQLASAKANGGGSEKQESEILSLRQKLQESNELVAERDFILEQRNRELAQSKEQLSGTASNASIQELEDDKRLIEIEKHKLREKIEEYEADKQDLEDQRNKLQREINVEKRDAEISLREMQTKIKEEQLKSQVQKAQLEDEIRKFDQARQNFQEDVQDLQSRQTELKRMEDHLKRLQKDIDNNVASAATALPSGSSRGQSSDLPEQAPASSEIKDKPDTWSKPPIDSKTGRGPLRIGKKSSF